MRSSQLPSGLGRLWFLPGVARAGIRVHRLGSHIVHQLLDVVQHRHLRRQVENLLPFFWRQLVECWSFRCRQVLPPMRAVALQYCHDTMSWKAS